MDKRVAVVILNYNGAAMLARFLPSVVEHSPEAQIVVADNGSADDSVARVRALFPAVRVIELGSNFGFADGYNRALAQVDADYYILLNNDVEVTKGWIAPLLAQMEADEKVVACQPKILSYNNKNKFEYAGAAGGFIDCYVLIIQHSTMTQRPYQSAIRSPYWSTRKTDSLLTMYRKT